MYIISSLSNRDLLLLWVVDIHTLLSNINKKMCIYKKSMTNVVHGNHGPGKRGCIKIAIKLTMGPSCALA